MSRRRRRPSARTVVGIVAVVAISAAVVTSVTDSGNQPARSTSEPTMDRYERRSVLVAIGHDQTDPTGSSALESLDAETGVTQWSTDLAVAPDCLVGTDLLAIGSPDATSTLVDMATGKLVGQLDGPTIATDHVGRFYVRREDDIVQYDLGDGFRKPVVVAVGLDDPIVAIVGGDVLASGPQGWTASIASVGSIGSEREVLEGSDDFPTAAALLPMAGTAFVVAGAGSIVGATSTDATYGSPGHATAPSPRCIRPNVVSSFTPRAKAEPHRRSTTDETANAVVTLTMTPGLFDSLVVTGNGVLTKKTDPDGPRLAGLDLDGNEMWAIRGVTAASVGDRLIVTTTRLDDGSLRLDAVGDLPTP